MNETTQDEQLNNLPESTIQTKSRFSIIWLVPVIALLIGAWIAFKAWSEMGPTITIIFKTAEGLEAEKTKIKFKNVKIGQVRSINLNNQTKAIEVIAEMNKNAKAFLTDQTRFWVVSARINATGVSGLETLLSGAYIGIDPSTEGTPTHRFEGLDIPPVITQNIPGKHFLLKTKNLGSIERDVPVYYRKFNVGKVEDVKLDDNGELITVKVFIRAPYDQWINDTTKFWNSSGIDFSMSASGINLNTESLVSMLIGGIAFDSDLNKKNVTPAKNNSQFKLYKDKEQSLKIEYKLGIEYVINFSESVRGLTVGAPVEFSGIQLGEVTAIDLLFDAKQKKITVPVTVRLDYGRIKFRSNHLTGEQLYESHEQRINYMLKQGLRAQLQTGNLITGQLFINVDFFPDAAPYTIDWSASIPEFPAVPGVLGVVKHDLTSILKKVDAAMTQINALSRQLNHKIAPELSHTLKQTKKSLAAIENTLKNDSPVQQDLQSALREIAKAARSIRNLSDYLERHPESLIEGKKGD